MMDLEVGEASEAIRAVREGFLGVIGSVLAEEGLALKGGFGSSDQVIQTTNHAGRFKMEIKWPKAQINLTKNSRKNELCKTDVQHGQVARGRSKNSNQR